MAPAQKNPPGLKQKSLMGWFSAKQSAPDASKPAKSTTAESSSKGKGSSTNASGNEKTLKKKQSDMELDTDVQMSSEPSAQTSSAIDSDGGNFDKLHSTPPTSDPIDVDMEEDLGKSTTSKRKSSVVDSDEEEEQLKPRFRRRSASASSNLPSSDVEEASSPGPARAKKPRVSLVESDDDEEGAAVSAAMTKRLSRFKKPATPKKSRKSLGSRDGDSDFVLEVEEFSDVDIVPPTSSRRGSSMSRSEFDAESASEMSDAPRKKAPAKKSSGRPPMQKGESSGGGGNTFLTAAEQREKDKKTEKKSNEDAFDFLKEVRDKDKKRPGEPGYDPRTIYIPPAAWKTFTPFETQFWKIKQNHYDTVLFFQKGKFLELYEDDARIGHQHFDLKLTERVKMSMVGVPEYSFSFWAAKFLAKGNALLYLYDHSFSHASREGKKVLADELRLEIGAHRASGGVKNIQICEAMVVKVQYLKRGMISNTHADCKGYKVGRVDQAETALGAEMRLAAGGKGQKSASSDKIVRRELNKVYTNGTLVDADLLTDEQAGHCVSIRESDPDSDSGSFGICVLDTSTSEFNMSAFDDDACRTKLETMMRQLRVKEIVFTKGKLSVSTTRLLKAVLPGSCLWTALRECEGFNFKDTMKELRELYPGSEDSMEEDSSIPEAIRRMLSHTTAVEALGSMIWYLRQLNIDKDILSMKNFNIYDPMKKGQGLVLDGQTLAHIEVLQNSEGTDEGSLLKILGRCITPFGKRLFRIWLCLPLRETSAINTRLDAVQELMDHPTFESDFTDLAKGMPDLERIVSRIHAKNCKIKDFLKVLASFKKLSEGIETLSETAESFSSQSVAGLLRSAPDVRPNVKNITKMFRAPKKEEKEVDDLIPESKVDKAYDEINEKIRKLEDSLDESLKDLKSDLGISLTYWHSAIGTKDIYLVQTKAGQKVPKNWTKNGSTKAFSRWNVPELAGTIRKLKEERETRNGVIKDFRFRLFAEFDRDRDIWLRAVRALAELDCLFSLAKSSSAIGEPACRPEFVENGDGAFIEFEELRHPALCLHTESFIPNDVKLGGAVGKVALLTGPNMGGKSTVMRMTAVGIIMAQLGMLVPAKSARLSPVDSILTRMGAYDNMFSNASTFKVELDECCKILRDATPRSLVILDELGRGTSTYDGMAIAGAVLHQLATHTMPLSFFATHYGSLTDDFAYHPNIRNMHMSTLVDDEKCELIFLYKLVEGIASSSFGTHVANLAGVPMDVVKRAEVISTDFAKQFKERIEGKRSSAAPLVAQADFAYLYRLATGDLKLPEDKMRRKAILRTLKAAVPRYVRTVGA